MHLLFLSLVDAGKWIEYQDSSSTLYGNHKIVFDKCVFCGVPDIYCNII